MGQELETVAEKGGGAGVGKAPWAKSQASSKRGQEKQKPGQKLVQEVERSSAHDKTVLFVCVDR